MKPDPRIKATPLFTVKACTNGDTIAKAIYISVALCILVLWLVVSILKEIK